MRPQKIILHHSKTKDSGTVSMGAIRNYHTKVLGWKDIGYHAVVELVESGGELHYEVLLGRSWFQPGAHCKGHNADSLGLCFVGDYDASIPDFGLLAEGAKIVALWMALFQLRSYSIYFDRDFHPEKTCPGKLFPREKFVQMVMDSG